MTPPSLGFIDIALGLATLSVAAMTLIARSRTTQAMGFLALGALLSTVWVTLGSIDVALAEAALGSGILGAILVWLAVASPSAPALPDDSGSPSRPRIRIAIGFIAGALTSLVAIAAWTRVADTLPRWDSPLAERLPDTGVTHEVTGVLLAFRAYDTLLESAVLLLAAITVLALGRDGGLTQLRHRRPHAPSTLSWVVRFSAPLLLLFGLWLLFAGSSQAGGAFQSGAVLCALLILMHTAGFGLERFAQRWILPLLVIGVIAFIAAAMAGPLAGKAWLTWEPAWAFSAILVVETLLTVGIMTGLFVIYLALENPRVAGNDDDAHAEPDQEGAER